MLEINYFAEIFLPSKSAYSIHVMKMCDAFSNYKINTNLHIFNIDRKNKVFRDYNCNNKFKIFSYGIDKNNFIGRLIYALRIFIKFSKKNDSQYFYSRSILAALLMAFLGRNVVIEIHHNLKGFSALLFFIFKRSHFFKKIKFVYITENLKKYFNLKNKSIVLDDAVDLKNFINRKSRIKFKNTCVYCGSFSDGKGIKLILEISRMLPQINFHLYGDIENSNYNKVYFKQFQNVKYLGFSNYKDIPKILSKYSIYLMPYSEKVYVRSKNIEVGKFMSPMKLFEYMASNGVLMATNLKVYRHILNNKNSILIKNSIKNWKKKVYEYFENPNKYKHLSKNANRDVKKFTWKKRVKKILKFVNKK